MNYETMVKCAYEEIVGEIEKEAAGYEDGIKSLGKKLNMREQYRLLENNVTNRDVTIARLNAMVRNGKKNPTSFNHGHFGKVLGNDRASVLRSKNALKHLHAKRVEEGLKELSKG